MRGLPPGPSGYGQSFPVSNRKYEPPKTGEACAADWLRRRPMW